MVKMLLVIIQYVTVKILKFVLLQFTTTERLSICAVETRPKVLLQFTTTERLSICAVETRPKVHEV